MYNAYIMKICAPGQDRVYGIFLSNKKHSLVCCKLINIASDIPNLVTLYRTQTVQLYGCTAYTNEDWHGSFRVQLQ